MNIRNRGRPAPVRDGRSNVPCQFFARGRCRNGTSCPFSHGLQVGEADTVTGVSTASTSSSRNQHVHVPGNVSDTSWAQADSRSRIPCRFLQRGSCLKGDKCPFSHENVTTTAPQKQMDINLKVDSEEDMKTTQENWTRELNGALVTFGDGASVRKVNFPSDFSAVRISNLPPDTTTQSVIESLALAGFVNIPEDCIRISHTSSVSPSSPPANDITGTHKRRASADIRVEDPLFAKTFCALPIFKKHDDKNKSPQAIPINAPMPQTTNYRRVDSKKVYCSWHKPTRTAWLNFGNGDIAAKVASKFSSGVYKVLDYPVTQCVGPTRAAGEGGHTTTRNPLAWTIRISDLPGVATEHDVTRDIPRGMAPRHVEMSDPSYDPHEVDLPTANALIVSLLMQAGPLESWEGATSTTGGGGGGGGKRYKAQARFMSDADARQAVRMFHDSPLPFTSANGGKLTVQLVHSARFKITCRVYDAIEQEINKQHRTVWMSQYLRYRAYDPSQGGFRVLKIEGEVSSHVASAKAALERIIRGEVLMNWGGQEAVWIPSLASNGSVYKEVRRLERDLGIVIVCDKRKCQIRLLGSLAKVKKARVALLELDKQETESSLSSSTGAGAGSFIIELDDQLFTRAFRGGYLAIVAAIGEDKITLDIVSTPRRIIIAGSEADFKTAKEILNGTKETSITTSTLAEDEISNDCAICWTEAENPVILTSCKHTYCSGCFEDLCFSGVNNTNTNNNSSSKLPCIRCQGEAGTCLSPIPLAELQNHLSSSSLEDILEAAFTAHVSRNLNDLKYCPTPNCDQLYRATSTDKPSSLAPTTSSAPVPLFSLLSLNTNQLNTNTSTDTHTNTVFTCPSCLTATCTKCHFQHHDTAENLTCAKYRDKQTGGHEATALKKTKQKLGIKDCPQCGIMIEKTDGCNHMTCSACGAHICWVCMRIFKNASSGSGSGGESIYEHMHREHGGIGVEY